MGVLAIRTFGTCATILGFVAVEHTETIVVFGGEDYILHAGSLGCSSHLVGMELGGIEGADKVPVVVFILVVSSALTVNPGLVADIPRLHNAPLGVDAPMHHKAELQILPLIQTVQDNRVSFWFTVTLSANRTHRE